jgi:hypothetical protein
MRPEGGKQKAESQKAEMLLFSAWSAWSAGGGLLKH